MGQKVYKNGYDYMQAPLGDTKPRRCLICNTQMILEKKQKGATSYAHAMAIHFKEAKPSKYNSFTCENAGEEWHNFAGELMDELEGTKSPSLKKVIQEDLNIVRREKQWYKGVL